MYPGVKTCPMGFKEDYWYNAAIILDKNLASYPALLISRCVSRGYIMASGAYSNHQKTSYNCMNNK